MIDNFKIAYAAGYFDADGCITTSGTSGFRLTVSSTDYGILVWLVDNFGGVINNQHLPSNPKHSVAWKWVVAKKQSVHTILTLLEPFLIVKRGQAQSVIAFLDKHGLSSKTNRRITEEEKVLYLKTKEEVRILKTDKHYSRSAY